MPDHPRRLIYATGPQVDRFEFLQSLFVAECLQPSRTLWISSPWISDITVIDNGARRFGALDPGWPAADIPLSLVISTILARGTRVTIVVRHDQPQNANFLRAIRARASGRALRVLGSPGTHDKGIVGDGYSLYGSMNLTHRGMWINDEFLVFDCDPSVAAERRIGLEERWGTMP